MVLILRTAGTNCGMETAFAFERAGAEAELVHINRLVSGEDKLSDYQILAIPGGFTYGDDIASGKILANELKYKLGSEMKKFVDDGKLVIGICNGFQVLVKAGFLPDVTLTLNDSAKFEDRWVYLRGTRDEGRGTRDEGRGTKCVWAKNLPEIIYLPVAHGEGKFVAKDEQTLKKLKDNNQVVFRYVDETGRPAGYPANPNGSVDDIAGICDTTGRIFGLMPHPERHIHFTQHPRWTRGEGRRTRDEGRGTKDEGRRTRGEGDGLQIFKNGVEYAKNNL